MLCYFGNGKLTIDFNKSTELLKQAAIEYKSAEAQYKLGLYYQLGLNSEKDYQQAIAYYRQASDQGYNKADYRLGIIYHNGFGVNKDIQRATNLSLFKPN